MSSFLLFILGFQAAPGYSESQNYTYAIQTPFSYFALKGNGGFSGVAGGAFSYGGSLGWVTNGFACWMSGNAFDYGDALSASGYMNGGELELDADFDYETTYYQKNHYIGSRMGALYIPVILGAYGEEINTKGTITYPLQPVLGIGGGIRMTGASFGKGGLFFDLNCIYRYCFLDGDTGVTVLNTVTGVTGSLAIGIWFE
jgi:hypothetical protein